MASAIITVCFPMTLSAFLLPLQETTILMDTCGSQSGVRLVPEQNRILNIVYITGLILFALSLIILLVFTKTVYFPLRRITVGANEYASGNLTYSIKVDTQAEMGYLAATLNYMSSELNKLEEYQKTFIANVSHDFRSPLTSIKGYLEAILDGTIPPEMPGKIFNPCHF